MNPTERLLAAFDGVKTDRCPLAPKIWVDLAARLAGLEPADIIADPFKVLTVVIDAARLAGADAARLFFFPARRILEDGGQWIEVDPHGRRIGTVDLAGGWATYLDRAADFRLDDPDHIAFRSFRCHEAPRIDSRADVARMAVPDRSFWEERFGAQMTAALDHAAGDVACIGDCDTATLAWYVGLRGLQQAMFDLIEQPALVHAVMEKGVVYAVERGKFCIDHGLRILRLNDSPANMSVISPGMWREFIMPHMRAVCDELHRYDSGVKIYCHICGNILPVIEDLCLVGLDAIGPLDPLGGFSVADARGRVGDKVTLLGGVDTMSLLRGAPADVERAARQCRADGQVDGSRYILSSGCVVPPATPLENLRALRRAAG